MVEYIRNVIPPLMLVPITLFMFFSLLLYANYDTYRYFRQRGIPKEDLMDLYTTAVCAGKGMLVMAVAVLVMLFIAWLVRV